MLPKFLTHLDKQKAHKVTTLSTARRRYWCCTFPLVLLALLLVLHSDSSNAERDFNFNDSQVTLLEPKDEPILIDHHTSSSSSSSSSFQQHHHNHQQQQHHHHAEQDPYAVELSHCRYDDNEIVLSLVLKNYNWHDFNDSRKAKVLEKLSQFFAIPKEFITMESVTKHELFEMQKESLKKGNNKCHNNNNRKLGRVNFIIGCGSTYFTVTEPISKQIGQQVKDGALDNITGEKFGWWVIWRKQYKSRSVRNRRQIEGSGDDDEDDDYYDYEEDNDDVDPTTTPTHAHRHHHGDETSEITSNKLDVTINEKDNIINNNNAIIDNIDHNKINDDITAMKQTDPNDNDEEEDDEEEVEKTDSNLLLLNKKGNIDEEIVESVSQLESVITKTIENTKNLEDIPDIVVDQTEDDILAEVLQPIEEVETAAKNSVNLNLNTVYENANDVDVDDNNSNDFNVAEVLDSLTPSTTISSLTTNGGHNTPLGVNVQENLESLSDSTTPFSLTSSHSNKDNHLDILNSASSPSSSSSSSSTTHGHSHHLSSFGSSDTHHQHSVTEFTTTITNSHLTPVILTDTTTTTTTPLDSSSNTASSAITSSSSSSSSSSTMLSTVLKKDETTVEPEDSQDVLGKSSTTTVQSTDESNASVSVTTVQSPTTTISTTQATTTPAPPTPEVVSSTTALPDYVEPKIENSPPMIKSRLQKLAVTSGKSFKLSVPEDTFYDNEDLSNLRLELTDKEGRELKSNSWLQFNAETKEIYGLPLDDAVSKWQYRLTATDSGNESVTETLEISVQQHRGVRTVNHEINISVKINEKNMHYIDWQMSLINAIANTLGDANTNSIVVREIRANPQDPNIATLVYFNETLPTSECPERELNNLVKRLDVSRLSDLVQPTLGIKSLTGQLIGPCQKTAAAKPKTPTLNVKNAPPVPRNQVDRVVATVGHLLVYKVPSDTFFDPNDNELTLSLKTKEHKELSPRHWLQFDSKNDEFYGIPKSGDAGSEEYMLVAEDAGGLTATDALVVQVNHAPKRDFSLYTKVYLAIKHEHFNADLQRKFVERMASLFGDASTQNIQIRSVTTLHDSDGTVVSFYNTTLHKSHNRCPEDEMEAFRSVLFHDYSVRERVKKAMGPELNITNIQIIPLGSCNVQTDVTHREFVPSKTDEPLLKSTFSDDYMFTIILPAIIIVSMILIASIIACCLHRRRRKSGKMELGDEEERKSFRTKGIPVIFQDELDEKPEIGNKSPIILKDEKPPLLPPSYNTSNMNV
ncbi:serine-rich adhesin for platelets isoform X2 [Lucilia sericata]|uniref:serine-rich adhesin for platelets isoform X2 n=1 Tax=Lucilia sericata TaxID=13632 RepID=UPI0018A85C42|nr:serine-rich adhesin for platelets isoform X2 [Lucilia sericata]